MDPRTIFILFIAVFSGSGIFDSESRSSRTSGSSIAASSSSSSSTSGTSDLVDLTSLLSGNQCKDCVVNGELLRGGVYFTFRSGCIEHVCDCYCNGTYYCAQEKTINVCELDKGRTTSTYQ